MTRETFFTEFAEIVGLAPGAIDGTTELGSLEGWDSVAYLSTMVLIDEQCGVMVTPDCLTRARTVGDILAAAGMAAEAA